MCLKYDVLCRKVFLKKNNSEIFQVLQVFLFKYYLKLVSAIHALGNRTSHKFCCPEQNLFPDFLLTLWKEKQHLKFPQTVKSIKKRKREREEGREQERKRERKGGSHNKPSHFHFFKISFFFFVRTFISTTMKMGWCPPTGFCYPRVELSASGTNHAKLTYDFIDWKRQGQRMNRSGNC